MITARVWHRPRCPDVPAVPVQSHLVALVRAGATVVDQIKVEREDPEKCHAIVNRAVHNY